MSTKYNIHNRDNGSSSITISVGLFCVSTIWYLNTERKKRRTQKHLLLTNHVNSNTIDGSNNGIIGSRGYKALSPPIPYLKDFLHCLQNPCDPNYNNGGDPKGYIALCMAENKLVLDILAERLMQPGTASSAFSDSIVYCYNSFLGLPVARDAIAYFIAKRFYFDTTYDMTHHHHGGESNHDNHPNHHHSSITPEIALNHIKPNHIAIGSGCVSLLNHIFFILGESGDACLIPSPYYAAFKNDINMVADCIPFGFHMENMRTGPTEKDLEVGYQKAKARGLTPRFLLLTNPNNPLGVIYEPHIIKNAIKWARKHNIQTIVDEIYALSTHKKYNHGFQSVIKILNNQLGNDVYMLWALSKDFAASGLRVGVIYTQNELFMDALSNLNIFSGVSGPIQYVVSELLTDDHFVDAFLDESRLRIVNSYNICVHKLEEMVLPYTHADAGLFIYVDFSTLLPRKTFDYEVQLSTLFFTYAKLVLTPGQCQNEHLPGRFRICYTWISPEVLQIAMERLSCLVAKIRRLDWDDLNDRTLKGII